MLKKIDQSRLFYQRMPEMFRCPLCQASFLSTTNGLICQKNHRFDLSKRNVVFLSHAIKTEYDQGMFAPRRRMIQSGMYQPLIEQLAKHLPSDATVLDVGCGEGSFWRPSINYNH